MSIEEKINQAEETLKEAKETGSLGVLVEAKADLVGLYLLNELSLNKVTEVVLVKDLRKELVKFFEKLCQDWDFVIRDTSCPLTELSTSEKVIKYCQQNFSWQRLVVFSDRLLNLFKPQDRIIKKNNFVLVFPLESFDPEEIDNFIRLYNLPYIDDLDEDKEELNQQEKEKLMKRLKDLGYL